MARSSAARKRTTEPTGQTTEASPSAERKPTPVHSTKSNQALQLNRLIHERTRLAIVSALAVNTSLSFTELKTQLNITDGNLSVHARKLEEADYIACSKTFEKRVPKTQYKLTRSGRRALERYLDHMEALIEATRDH